MVYKIIKIISFLIRYGLCYITIEQILLFESETAQRLWSLAFGGVLYSILWAICYFLVGVTSQRFSVNSSSAKSILYFALYIVFVSLIFGILKLLTHFGVLPIGEEITFQFENYLSEKISFVFQWLSDRLVHLTNTDS